MTGPERPPPLLDWSDRGRHWGKAEAACRYCGHNLDRLPTQLRDDDKKPAHKVCAEKALAAEQARTVAQYQQGRTA